MKQIKIKGKLSLDKMTIAKLNEDMTGQVRGGDGILSIIGNTCPKKNCAQPFLAKLIAIANSLTPTKESLPKGFFLWDIIYQ